MIRRMRALLAFTALVVAPTVLAAQAVNLNGAGVAVDGYDPVAYFVAGRAERGAVDVTAMYDGATYLFATAANRDLFAAAPAKYLPAYGGYCAYGVASGYKVKIDPDAFTIVDGTLYLNYSKGVQRKWMADVPGYIAKANSQWTALKDAPRE